MRVKTFISILFLTGLIQACGNYPGSNNINRSVSDSSSPSAPITLPALTAVDEPPAQAFPQVAAFAPWVQLKSMDAE